VILWDEGEQKKHENGDKKRYLRSIGKEKKRKEKKRKEKKRKEKKRKEKKRKERKDM
jgi:hypothetical protein